MNKFLLRLLGLLALAAGAALAAAALNPAGLSFALWEWLRGLIFSSDVPRVAWRLALTVSGGGLALLGLAGLLIDRGGRRRRILFRTDHGEVEIELAPIQKTLTRVIGMLPEVRRIRVRVTPDQDARRVHIAASVVLQNYAEQGLRRSAQVVSDCIAGAVSRSFGLEDAVTVELSIKGLHVDARAAARRLRDEADSPPENAPGAVGAALARPPLSALTLDGREEPAPAEAREAETPETDAAGDGEARA